MHAIFSTGLCALDPESPAAPSGAVACVSRDGMNERSGEAVRNKSQSPKASTKARQICCRKRRLDIHKNAAGIEFLGDLLGG